MINFSYCTKYVHLVILLDLQSILMYDFTLKSSQAVSYLDIGSVLYKFLKRDWKF